ncbi:periplasmic component of amino acid ABC-type transporter/signal transduction system [Pseudomonas sp. GM102]|uniref:substrate-binding periplasmic protein n=1 Tax=Pseudomonas sp. GM102 TaxID=1144321 RepID=UPI00026F8A08|nr:transporter substrate-binding domain-containing protein [Pseudomonas sp. GM102]EJL95972.1 periplasmic component of amino acid ABC-type transporter/signal transduction system [Pseudomonas sp. GM102]
MRFALGALLLVSLSVAAAEAPLRFVVSDSWAMPMVQLERGRPTQGILYDMMLSLATQVGMPAEFHVLPRARVQNAMDHGEVDVRCHVSPSWLPNLSGDYSWSVPLLVQRDLLIGRRDSPTSVNLASLSRQSIGTVRGYNYPTLQPLFDSDRLNREDARNQEQVLEKLLAGRYHYAVSNQWTLDWFNQRLLPDRQLQSVALVHEQTVGCYVRNDPKMPVQRILNTLLQMKTSGEINDIIRLYTGNPGQ